MSPLYGAVLASMLATTAVTTAFSKELPSKPTDATAQRQHANEAAERGFSAMMHIATDEEAERFLHEWKTTPAEHAPALAFTDTAVRGDVVSTMVFYSGCAADEPEGSECPARIDLQVITPDGSIHLGYTDQSLAQGQPTAAKRVQLSPVNLRIRFDPEDPLGMYRVQARIDDPERDIVLKLETSIELKADGSKE